VSQEPDTPGDVFAAALQQWREALQPAAVAGAPPRPDQPPSTAAHDPE
jgi:hypothetical protein